MIPEARMDFIVKRRSRCVRICVKAGGIWIL
jgi:hypothetical protein